MFERPWASIVVRRAAKVATEFLRDRALETGLRVGWVRTRVVPNDDLPHLRPEVLDYSPVP